MSDTETARQHSEHLPMFRWTRAIVMLWMKFTLASWVPRVLRMERDLFIDLYLMFMTPFLFGVLLLNSHARAVAGLDWVPTVSIVIAIWVLQEVACVTLHDLVRDTPIRGKRRWMLATLPTVAQVVFCFAILYLNLGEYFLPRIDSWITALYASVVTFSTLGYGDVHPNHQSVWGEVLVVCEMSLFLLLVVIRVPMAVSMLRIRDSEES